MSSIKDFELAQRIHVATYQLKTRIEELEAECEKLRADAERMGDALEKIRQWSEAYPLDIFPEPDLKQAHKVRTAAGMTLDALSAHAMRHVLTQVQKIVDAAREGK